MTDKFNAPEQGNMYDKIFRENMEDTLPDIIEDVLHLHIVKSEEIPDDVQHTKERKPDLLKRVEDADGNIFILHIEYQRNNDETMAYRMAEYSIMLQRKHELLVTQFVIYIGVGKPTMPTKINTKYLSFWYNMIALSSVDCQIFLGSDKIEQKMLAILGDLSGEDPEHILRQIVHEIESQGIGELEEGRYLRQLRVLLQLRNLDKESINNMALTGKIFIEEKDILYIRGEHTGQLKERVEIARKMKKEGIATTQIIKFTNLSVEEIKKL